MEASGSGSSCPFKIETIQKSLEALYLEKTSLAQQLEELQRRRWNLEEDNENSNSKLVQVSERHEKMLDTLKIAKTKAENMEVMARSLEEIHAQKLQGIQDIKSSTEQEKQSLLASVKQFEEQIQQLSDMFVNAKEFYAKDELNKQIFELKTKAQEMSDTSKLEDQLKIARDKLHQVTNNDVARANDDWNMIVAIFEEENKTAKNVLEQMEEEISSLKKMK